MLIFRPAPEAQVRVVVQYVDRPPAEAPPRPDAPAEESAPPSSPPSAGADYLTLRQQVERWGDAGLPPAAPATEERPARADPFDLPPDVQADPWLRRRNTQSNTGGPL